jgi:hypothetical protein
MMFSDTVDPIESLPNLDKSFSPVMMFVYFLSELVKCFDDTFSMGSHLESVPARWGGRSTLNIKFSILLQYSQLWCKCHVQLGLTMHRQFG